ncbi:hypothetical protein T484DRAFT_2412273 [Baffinella frigidus]|nr:hypothetical protein T484DRAFT_2412273 [Cryptophyta sp. CCMP2293]
MGCGTSPASVLPSTRTPSPSFPFQGFRRHLLMEKPELREMLPELAEVCKRDRTRYTTKGARAAKTRPAAADGEQRDMEVDGEEGGDEEVSNRAEKQEDDFGEEGEEEGEEGDDAEHDIDLDAEHVEPKRAHTYPPAHNTSPLASPPPGGHRRASPLEEGVRPAANQPDGASSIPLYTGGRKDGKAPLGAGGEDGKRGLEQKAKTGWREGGGGSARESMESVLLKKDAKRARMQDTPASRLSDDDSDDLPVTELVARGAKKRGALEGALPRSSKKAMGDDAAREGGELARGAGGEGVRRAPLPPTPLIPAPRHTVDQTR